MFDEFDIFMRSYSSIKTESSRSDRSSSERSQSHAQIKSEITVDEVGSQLFATLKTCMSGDGLNERVFSIATTNNTDIPLALSRGGRFDLIQLNRPFEGRDLPRTTSTQF
jgi:SpoVK/Ycf46/Vps4 family AAA+-type ATPase